MLIDDAGAEEAGYLLIEAAQISAEQICLMMNKARGTILAAIPENRLEELRLKSDRAQRAVAQFDFTLSVEARKGVTTGISAKDRAATLRTLATTTKPRTDLVTPGHVFPVLSREGGLLARASIAEAASDLLSLSGCRPVGALCQCLDKGGSAVQGEALESLANELGIQLLRSTELIAHRAAKEQVLESTGTAQLPLLEIEGFQAQTFRSRIDGAEHLVFSIGDIAKTDSSSKQVPVMTRVQSEHPLSDLLGLGSIATRQTHQKALEKIAREGRGVFVYIRHPKKGLILNQIKKLQEGETTTQTMAASLREYCVGAQILRCLGIQRLHLLSNSEWKMPGLDAFDIEIVSSEPV